MNVTAYVVHEGGNSSLYEGERRGEGQGRAALVCVAEMRRFVRAVVLSYGSQGSNAE
jgi:hypothetical protein